MARYLAIALSAWVAAAAAVQAQQTPPAAGSDGVPVPRRVRSVQPAYPPEAAAAGLRGIVILELTIDTAGKVTDVRVVRSVPPFDEAAVTAARRWEYEPSVVGGHPSPVRLTVPVTFSLRLPEVERQPGIPELRAGGRCSIRPGKGKGSAVVTITMSPSGTCSRCNLSAATAPSSKRSKGRPVVALRRHRRRGNRAVPARGGVCSWRLRRPRPCQPAPDRLPARAPLDGLVEDRPGRPSPG